MSNAFNPAEKAKRLQRLFPGGKGVWIPIDHGASDYPCEGLDDLEAIITGLIEAGVDAIVAQKGVVNHYHGLCEGTSTSMVVHYSVSTRHGGVDSSNKVLVGHADETVSRGGIGVSAQVNMGSPEEAAMIERMGQLNRDAHHLNLPSFGMVYARGNNLNPVEGDATMRFALLSNWDVTPQKQPTLTMKRRSNPSPRASPSPCWSPVGH